MDYKQMLERFKISIHRQRAKNERRNAKIPYSLTKPNYWKKHEKKTDYNIKLTDFLKKEK